MRNYHNIYSYFSKKSLFTVPTQNEFVLKYKTFEQINLRLVRIQIPAVTIFPYKSKILFSYSAKII